MPQPQMKNGHQAASVYPKSRNINRRPSDYRDNRTAAAENFAHLKAYGVRTIIYGINELNKSSVGNSLVAGRRPGDVIF
jgi:hypothetical protein